MYFLLCVTYIISFFLGYLLSKKCQTVSPSPVAKKVQLSRPIFVQFVSSQGWSMDIIIDNDRLTRFYKLVSSQFIGSWYKQLKHLDSFIHPSGLYVIRLMIEKTNEMMSVATDEQLVDFFTKCHHRLVQERFRCLVDGSVGTGISSMSTKEDDE